MSNIVEDPGPAIARRIRLEREARNWSLADLAERSGVSKATISKIERDEMSPTATILLRLASAFELTLAGLLLRVEGGDDRLSRAADQPLWRDPETGYVRRQIYSRPGNPVELVEVEMPAGGRVAIPASSYARIRQVVWVRAGTLTVVEGPETTRVGAGDCLGFGPPSDVVFANETDAPCLYVVALARN